MTTFHVGDKVKDLRGNKGVIIAIDNSLYLVEYYDVYTVRNFYWDKASNIGRNQIGNYFSLLKDQYLYYWLIEEDLTLIYPDLIILQEKMVSGCRCIKCNDFNEYVEVAESAVKTWVCRPCRS